MITNKVRWFNSELPLKDQSILNNEEYLALAEIIEVQPEAEYFGIDWFEPYSHAIKILDAQYEQIDIN